MNPIEQARAAFARDKYVIISNFLPQEVLMIFSMYPILQERRYGSHKDDQVPDGAHSSYAEPLIESLLVILKPIVEDVVGKELFPTYSYYRNYRPGSELVPHTDRESCEYTVSLCLSFTYDDDSYRWPLTVGGQDIVMDPGDLVIYMGAELNHSRLPLEGSENTVHSQAFLHYVDANGKHASEKYDKRPAVGMPAHSRRKDGWTVV